MAMGGIDDDEVAFRIDKGAGAFQPLVTHGRGSGHAQAACRVLGRLRIGDGLFDILHRDEANATIGVIDHQQLLDPALVQQAHRLFLPDAELYSGEILLRHQFADRLGGIFGEPHVPVGQDASQLARCLDYRDAADAMARHQLLRLGQRCLRRDRDRVHHHAAFEALDRADGIGLFLDRQIAMQHAKPAELRHDDRHIRFRHRIHGGGKDRDIEPDFLRHLGAGVGLTGQHLRGGGLQQHIVEGKTEADIHGAGHFHLGEFGIVAAHVIISAVGG